MPTAAQEKLWDYDAVQPGQDGSPTVVQLSAEHIAAYAQVAQNPDPRFHVSATNAEYGGKLAAMPTMILTYAPLMRPEIAEHQGFVALEDSTTARRQTPFAKCEVCWFKPVLAGDTLTGTRHVFEKYERRGSRFVTFRIEASNQRGEAVARYDYTCIFSYAKGQQSVPAETPMTKPVTAPVETRATTPAPPRVLTFDTATIGDALTPLSVTESVEADAIPLSLGGDHAVTYPIVAALAAHYGPLNILHFDAHPDLYADFEGNPRSHASPFARILEEGHAKRIVQVGIRTLNKHCREQAERYNVEILPMLNFDASRVPIIDGPLYISIDLDGIDPSEAPGVAHPEPGGLTIREVLSIIAKQRARIVGADIVELNPARDVNDITAIVAA